MDRKDDGEIILVHGLWFGSWAMFRLARRLEKASGLPVRRVNYRTTRGELADHASRLHRFARQGGAGRQHLVGHSLGGLVVLKMLSEFDDIAPGRLVFLGSPLHGSTVARKAEKIPGATVLLGKIRSALEQGYPAIPGGREAGMIAGSKSIGLGWIVGGTEGPGDGTVAIAETVADGLTDHCILPVTHTGMLYSPAVAEMTARFLETGAFGRPNA
ncbi:MAG: alpha/beta fold hydrolase [Xanthomonadales bacterium]|jgi:pimeloyl-ACP methyl ester carboxylesterase|nr:alpha/beta fold hydrolase [Xanthomonadales bacterium]